jgi:hypothetical protein
MAMPPQAAAPMAPGVRGVHALLSESIDESINRRQARQKKVCCASRPNKRSGQRHIDAAPRYGDPKRRRSPHRIASEKWVLSPEHVPVEDGAEGIGVHPAKDLEELPVEAGAEEEADQAPFGLVIIPGHPLGSIGGAPS